MIPLLTSRWQQQPEPISGRAFSVAAALPVARASQRFRFRSAAALPVGDALLQGDAADGVRAAVPVGVTPPRVSRDADVTGTDPEPRLSRTSVQQVGLRTAKVSYLFSDPVIRAL